MAGVDGSDPFFWDVDVLVQELCTSNRTWQAPPASKLPDPEKLAKSLREHDLDGQTLLTYEDDGGREAFDSLCKDLGIKKIPHKASLHDAIRQFKERSQEYPRWKKAHYSQRSNHPADGGTPKTESSDAGLVNLDLQKEGLSGDGNRQDAVPNGDSIEQSKPPRRNRRVAPTNVASAPLRHKRNELPTEADVFATPRDIQASNEIWQASAEGAYLGHWKLEDHSMLRGCDPLSASNEADESDSFGWAQPMPIPPGRRVLAQRTLRRYLNPRKSQLNLGRSRKSHHQDARLGEDDDIILPAFGESDDEYDSETWAEMQEEEAERQNPQSSKKLTLTDDEVEAIILEAIEDIKTQWREKKQSKLPRKAYKLWTDAQRYGTRRVQVERAVKLRNMLDERIAKMTKEILSMSWVTKADVERQTVILEQSVEDQQEQAWIVQILNSVKEPKKPKRDRAKAVSRKPRKVKARLEDGDEVLTSGSEDGLDGFIDDDMDFDNDFPPGQHSQAGIPFDQSMSTSEIESGVDRYDLTQMVDSSDEEDLQPNNVVGLTLSSPAKRQDDVAQSLESLDAKFPFNNPKVIADMGPKHWERLGDGSRLLITMLVDFDSGELKRLFHYSHLLDGEFLWKKFFDRALEKREPCEPPGHDTPETIVDDTAFAFIRFFDAFTSARALSTRKFIPLNDNTAWRIKSNQHRVSEFGEFLRGVIQYFPQSQPSLSTPSRNKLLAEADDMDLDEAGIEHPSDEDVISSSQKQKRQIRRDKAAQDLRDNDRARLEEQEERRKALREQLAISGTIPKDKSRLIINEAKEDNEGLIYINDEVGHLIKDHQIEGVRFMWNQIVADKKVRQGCLLAHTMGLGKTMQVITLLVAIAEAAASRDETIYSQIPLDLRESKTLVLCPSGLVDNWNDELLKWTPSGLLGVFYKIDAEVAESQRTRVVQKWASDGEDGVLIVGYHMFKKLVEQSEDFKSRLEKTPNIVIADEAHSLKNPHSKVHQATANFRTKTRIAMTGSPLANSVEEYHSLINWVAPNYLANHSEFVAVYANPIKEGFYKDSNLGQRRKALKILKVLKDTVAPKVHRATVFALKGELPPKKEFILYLPLTPLQVSAYRVFVDHLTKPTMMGSISTTLQLWNLVINLGLLLAHPKVFKTKMEKMKKELEKKCNAPQSQVAFSREAIGDLIASVNDRKVEELYFSSKVKVLLRILDESKRVGDKVLVFSTSKDVLDYLEELMRRQQRLFSRLDGDTRVNTRQSQVKNFNTGQDEVFLISTTAGGVGLNIYGANRVVIFDFKWNPINEQQAIGRAYRIGQTKPVYVYWLIIGGTYETILHDQAVFKSQLASRVVDKKNPTAWSQQLRDYTANPQVIQPEPIHQYIGKDEVLDALLKSDTREIIRKIVSADTFEEEEPETALTPEELQEAAHMIRMNQLRSQDPEEYARRQALEVAQRAQQAAPQGFIQGTHLPNAQGISQVSQPSRVQEAAEPASIDRGQTVNSGLEQARQEHVQHPQDSMVRLPIALQPMQLQGAPAVMSRNPPHMTWPSQQAGTVQPPGQTLAPVPMASGGVRQRIQPPAPPLSTGLGVFGTVSNSPGHDPRHTHPAFYSQGQLAQDQESCPTLPFSSNAEEFKAEVMRQAQSFDHSYLLTGGQTLVSLAEQVVGDIVTAFKQNSVNHIVAIHRWGILRNLARDHPRFVEAVLAGHFLLDDLAKSLELSSRIRTLESLSREDFQKAIQLRRQDPSVWPFHFKTPSTSKISNDGKEGEAAEILRRLLRE